LKDTVICFCIYSDVG